MREFLIAALLAASLQPALAEGDPVRIFDLRIEEEVGENRLRQPAYIVGYTIENTGTQTIEVLDLVVLGRNAEGRIVERVDNPAVWPRAIPGGLAAGDSIVQRHVLLIENPHETVESIEVRIHQIRFSD